MLHTINIKEDAKKEEPKSFNLLIIALRGETLLFYSLITVAIVILENQVVLISFIITI
jgi:hypothetical protein